MIEKKYTFQVENIWLILIKRESENRSYCQWLKSNPINLVNVNYSINYADPNSDCITTKDKRDRQEKGKGGEKVRRKP